MDEPWATHVELAMHGDWTAVRRLEEEIERRDLWRKYINTLELCFSQEDLAWPKGRVTQYERHFLFVRAHIRATPEQRARAFLAATEAT